MLNEQRSEAAVSTVNEREMLIDLRFTAHARFEGSSAQLVAEGVIPADMKWPIGKGGISWNSGGVNFHLKRCRPYDSREPMRVWAEGDWWVLTMRPSNWTVHDSAQWVIEKKAKELMKIAYLNTERGHAEFHASYDRYREACKDERFQAFKQLIPALIPPPKRERKPRSKVVRHD